MIPFHSMQEARDFFWQATQRQGGALGPKSCLVRFQVGVRRVSFLGGAVHFGSVVEVGHA